MIEKKAYHITDGGRTKPVVWLLEGDCYTIKEDKVKDKEYDSYDEAEKEFYSRCEKYK